MTKYVPTCPKCDSTLERVEVSVGYAYECHECDENFYEFEAKWREQMIDYEITVDVRGKSVETKQRVQDAFFKLGLKWARGEVGEYRHTGKDAYTNCEYNGEICGYIMYVGSKPRKPTHTIEELYELAGLKEKKRTNTFDLAKALAGEPVETVDGYTVLDLVYLKTVEDGYPVVATVSGVVHRFTVEGKYSKSSLEGSPSPLI